MWTNTIMYNRLLLKDLFFKTFFRDFFTFFLSLNFFFVSEQFEKNLLNVRPKLHYLQQFDDIPAMRFVRDFMEENMEEIYTGKIHLLSYNG